MPFAFGCRITFFYFVIVEKSAKVIHLKHVIFRYFDHFDCASGTLAQNDERQNAATAIHCKCKSFFEFQFESAGNNWLNSLMASCVCARVWIRYYSHMCACMFLSVSMFEIGCSKAADVECIKPNSPKERNKSNWVENVCVCGLKCTEWVFRPFAKIYDLSLFWQPSLPDKLTHTCMHLDRIHPKPL